MQESLLSHSWWNLHVSQNLEKNQLRNQEVIILQELNLNSQYKDIASLKELKPQATKLKERAGNAMQNQKLGSVLLGTQMEQVGEK